MKKSYEMDMCNGPLVGKILLFAFPLMLSSVLQLLFNAADIVVVGRFTGAEALAAVGATSALINLLVNVFMGLSIGTNVLTAQGYGARNEKGVQDTVHTSIMLSLVCGVLLIFIGVFLAAPLLELMGTPDNVLGHAALYMRIYFIGMPALLVYNFGAAILRAVGDTRRPLYYLLFSGIINVILNLIFVIIFKMGVAGVATATVVSETISAGLVLRCLKKTKGTADCADWSSGRSAGSDFFHFQRADPVFHQFLRLGCHGRKYGSRKPGGLCIHVYECRISDEFKLYQPEYGGRQLETDEKDPGDLPGFCVCGRPGNGKRICLLRTPAAWNLFF